MEIIKKSALFYNNEIRPKISHVRGATRIGLELQKLALRNQPQIPEDQAESITDKDDWDNLIILDACRYDTYKEVTGREEYRYSLGSATPEYVSENFSTGDWSDTVYITGNPHFYQTMFEEKTGRDPKEVFHEVYNVYETDWDEEKKVVLPEPIVRDTLSAEKLFPDKKKIIHFMQPHNPFLTSDLPQYPNEPISPESSIDVEAVESLTEVGMAQRGIIEKEETFKHYRENLEYVMPHVEKLVEQLDGKTVITSDHGEMLDENGFWGHPEGFNLKSLRKVPWDVRDDRE